VIFALLDHVHRICSNIIVIAGVDRTQERSWKAIQKDVPDE